MAVTQEVPPTGGLRTDTAAATSRRARRRGEGLMGGFMVGPAVVLLLVFFFVPVALCFALAFTNARLISPEPVRVVGFENFSRLFSDPVFWKSLRNTFYFAVVVVPLQSGLALLLALLVNAKVRGRNFFRTMYFVPVVTSIVVVSILWRFMYQPDGLVNHMLGALSFNVIQGTDWLWQAVGFHMVIWLSGLQTIPAELYEAAELDGAGKWHQFRYVTWPGLKATRTFILVTITIAALSLFAQINVMTQGGPLDRTTTVVFQAVRVGYGQQETAYASTISLAFFVLVLTVSLVQRYLTRERG
jgi:multiple sugar transport system permease protein